jgi:hypothetical protein
MTRRPLTQGLQRILAAMPDDWIDQDDLNQRLGYASGVARQWPQWNGAA